MRPRLLSSGSAAARGHRGGAITCLSADAAARALPHAQAVRVRPTLQPSSSMQPKFEYSVDTRQWCSSQRFTEPVMLKTKSAEDTSASTRTDIDFSLRDTQHTETGQAEKGNSLGADPRSSRWYYTRS